MSFFDALEDPADDPLSSPTEAASNIPTQTTESTTDYTRRNWLAGLLAQREHQLWSRVGRVYQQLLTTVRQRLQALSRGQRRRLIGRMSLTLTGAALMVALAQAANQDVRASTILVANGEVAVDDNDVCSLIEAINNANDTNNGLVHADCTAGDPGGADTVTLPNGGNFALSESYVEYIDSGTGLPVISSDVTIDGNGSTIARQAPNNRRFRHFAVNPDGHLHLNETTLSGGELVRSYGYGGAIASRGEVTITDSTISNNRAYKGGAIYSDFGFVTISNSTLSGNYGYNDGGAIYSYHTRLTVSGSTLNNNETYWLSGGAIYQYAGVLYIENSTLSGNDVGGDDEYGQYGGAIAMFGTEAVISSSTLSDNEAYYGGGAISAYDGTLTIVNSTISGNRTVGSGGGLYVRTMPVTIVNSTLTGNTADQNGGGVYGSEVTLGLARSLVSGNEATDGRELYVYDYNTTVNVNSHNIFGFGGNGGTTGFAPGATDIVPTAALGAILQTALADNDGQTQTHALPPGSPAIDAAPSAACSAPPTGGVDQRGQLRNSNGAGGASANECDIGAYELQGGGTGPTVTPSRTSPPPTATPTETPFIFPTETPTGQPTATPTVTGTPPAAGEGLFLPVVLDQ